MGFSHVTSTSLPATASDFCKLDNAKVSRELMEVPTHILYVFRCDMPNKLRIYSPYVKIMEKKSNHQIETLVPSAPNLECLVSQFQGTEMHDGYLGVCLSNGFDTERSERDG